MATVTRLPAGKHTGDIVLTKGDRLIGEGRKVTTVVGDITIDDHCDISDLLIQGTIRTAPTAARWTITRVQAHRTAVGFDLANTWIGSLRDCYASGCDIGVKLSKRSNAITISGGEYQSSRIGILGEPGGGVGLHLSTTVEGNTEYAVDLDGANGLALIGCWFEKNPVRIRNTDGLTISGNVIGGPLILEGNSNLRVEGNWTP